MHECLTPAWKATPEALTTRLIGSNKSACQAQLILTVVRIRNSPDSQEFFVHNPPKKITGNQNRIIRFSTS